MHTVTSFGHRVHRVDAPLGDRIVSLYLIVGDDQTLLFDTGVDGTIPASLVPAMRELGIDVLAVSTVIVSHHDVDHYGGIADSRDHFPDAVVLAHPSDRPAMESWDRYLVDRGRSFVDRFSFDENNFVLQWSRSAVRDGKIDRDVHHGETFHLGGISATILHVPGHTGGHLAVDVPDADAVLVSDAVLGEAVYRADGVAAFPPTYRFVDDYLHTIGQLRSLGRRHLLTAHYPTMSDHAALDFLRVSEQFVSHLEALIMEAFRSHPCGLSLAEICAIVNPRAGAWPSEGTETAMAFPVVGHLERLLSSGTAVTLGSGRDGALRFTLAT